MEKVKTVFDMEDMYGLDILGLGGGIIGFVTV